MNIFDMIQTEQGLKELYDRMKPVLLDRGRWER